MLGAEWQQNGRGRMGRVWHAGVGLGRSTDGGQSWEALKISAAGLQRRARMNPNGADERIFLQPLIEFAEANETPAERKLALFLGEWNGNIDPVFREFAY